MIEGGGGASSSSLIERKPSPTHEFVRVCANAPVALLSCVCV
jgi:hypothetical protein